ncbi:MAG: PAS domain-containing protein [bacterium]
MNTVIVGGGKGCRAIIKLTLGAFLKELPLHITCVADPDDNAPGMQFAREHGINTTTNTNKALSADDIDLVIELTGLDSVLLEIYAALRPGVRLIDHTMAHIFWDLARAREEQEERMQQLLDLERRLETEKRFLQDVVDNIPDLLVVIDQDKGILRTNKSFRDFAGVNFEDCVGKTCEEVLAQTELSEHAAQSGQIVRRVLQTGQPHSEVRFTSGPTEAHWEVSRVPFKNDRGEVKAVLCSWHRITEKVRLQREVESAEQRFKSFIDSAHDWISIKDLEGRYLIVNPVCARALGRAPEDFVGRHVEDVVEPEVAKLIRLHDQEVIRTNCHHTYDEVYQLTDGRDHHFQVVRFPLKDYKGSTIGACTISRDVTSEKAMSSQLAQAAKLAAVGKLAAGVAHEINNPLTGVLAYAEELREELEHNPELCRDIEVIIRETLRCRNIVRNLLDFAKLDAPHLERIDIAEVVDTSLMLVRKLPEFRNIVIDWNATEGIPRIAGDPQQLQQVILNLMLNASDAVGGKGTISIKTEYERREDKCVIMVRDSGPGIPENMMDKIFEPFFSTKDTNGLGLAVSWGIVERHRGIIEVDTAEDGGAIFRVVIPAAADTA